MSSENAQDGVLSAARVATRLPARDLNRARRFYAEQLGLEPSEERPGGLLYRCGGAEFALFLSTGSSPGTFTQMAWNVDDLDATAGQAALIYALTGSRGAYGTKPTADSLLPNVVQP